MISLPRLCLVLALVYGCAADLFADPRTNAVREAAERVIRSFGQEMAHETPELVAARLSDLVLRHGDDVLKAAQAVGPRAVPLLEQAGELAPQAARMLAIHGESALPVVAAPRQLALIGRYGDDMAEVLIRHHDIAVPLLTANPAAGIRAWGALNARNGRRLAILSQAGSLRQAAQSDRFLRVVASHGNQAMDFIWRNKGALAVSSVLAAFLADPEPFLSGGRDLSQAAVQSAGGQLAQASRQFNWIPALLAVAAVMGCHALICRRLTAVVPRNTP